MNIIKREIKLCMCCMEKHEVLTIVERENNIFKGVNIEYDAKYEYCDKADELIAMPEYISENDINMKNAYRRKMKLLETEDIVRLRLQYGVSQADLSSILGWGEKTITRYESHQVQDAAHDEILKKIGNDPEWFLSLLQNAKERLSLESYKKYFDKARETYDSKHDEYLRKTILSKYINFNEKMNLCGNTVLNLDKVVEMINYFASSPKVTNLYKVKLMKLLWYSDALSYKRYGHSITGLVYSAMPMGAVPLQHDLIIDLRGVKYNEVEFDEGTGYAFVGNDINYGYLSSEDKKILDTIINHFGEKSKNVIVDSMHQEKAYTETKQNDIIDFTHCNLLSIS